MPLGMTNMMNMMLTFHGATCHVNVIRHKDASL